MAALLKAPSGLELGQGRNVAGSISFFPLVLIPLIGKLVQLPKAS